MPRPRTSNTRSVVGRCSCTFKFFLITRHGGDGPDVKPWAPFVLRAPACSTDSTSRYVAHHVALPRVGASRRAHAQMELPSLRQIAPPPQAIHHMEVSLRLLQTQRGIFGTIQRVSHTLLTEHTMIYGNWWNNTPPHSRCYRTSCSSRRCPTFAWDPNAPGNYSSSLGRPQVKPCQASRRLW